MIGSPCSADINGEMGAKSSYQIHLLDWARTALLWDPTLDTRLHTRRRQGRPKTRWTDDIRNYVLSIQQPPNTLDNTAENIHDDNHNNQGDDNSWINVAQSEELWKSLEDGFVKRAS